VALAGAPPACPPIHQPPQITPLPQPQILKHRPPQHPPAVAGTPAGGRSRPQLLTCSPVHQSPQVTSSPRPPPAVDPPAGTPVADPPAGMPDADPPAPAVPPAAAAPLVCAVVDAPARLRCAWLLASRGEWVGSHRRGPQSRRRAVCWSRRRLGAWVGVAAFGGVGG
jgi:hypothetical protein